MIDVHPTSITPAPVLQSTAATALPSWWLDCETDVDYLRELVADPPEMADRLRKYGAFGIVPCHSDGSFCNNSIFGAARTAEEATELFASHPDWMKLAVIDFRTEGEANPACTVKRYPRDDELRDLAESLDFLTGTERQAMPAGPLWEAARALVRDSMAKAKLQLASGRFDLASFRLDRLTAGAPPPQKFLLTPLIPLATAGTLFGPGGVGKSLVALDLCLAVARRALLPPGNLSFMPGPLGGTIPAEAGGAAVFITLEDSKDEIHRRTASLDPTGTRAGAPVFVLPGVDIPELDPVMVSAVGRSIVLTEFAKSGLERILSDVEAACGYPPRLLVLDPAGDLLAADEDKAEVVKPLMRRLGDIAWRRQCTILLLGHVSKTLDPQNPTMRGSGVWIANSRFAYSLTLPEPEKNNGKRRRDKPTEGIVWGMLVKANHKGAPVMRRRLFQRDRETGRLHDVTAQFVSEEPDPAQLQDALVTACRDCAAAGKAFTKTGTRGLFKRRLELPPALAALSRAKLEELAETAMEGFDLEIDEGGCLVPAIPDPDGNG